MPPAVALAHIMWRGTRPSALAGLPLTSQGVCWLYGPCWAAVGAVLVCVPLDCGTSMGMNAGSASRSTVVPVRLCSVWGPAPVFL